jgi:predicted double-glycine peptidase
MHRAMSQLNIGFAARGLAAGICVALIACAYAHPACAQFNEYTRAPIRMQDRQVREYVWSYKELRERQVVMQQLDYSCGAATLATIARYYWGDNVTENTFLVLVPRLNLTAEQIRDRIENGLTLTDLRDMANMAGYQSSMGKVKFHELTEAKVPVIVGVTINTHEHFVVFRGYDGYYVYLADPIRGNIRTPADKFISQWQENAILVIAKPNAKVKDVNPLGIRFTEVFRGLLNDQTVNRNWTMVPQAPYPRFIPGG